MVREDLVLVFGHSSVWLPTVTTTTETNDLEFGEFLVIWTSHSNDIRVNITVILRTEYPIGSGTVTFKVGTRESGSDTKGGHTNNGTENKIKKFQLNECNEYKRIKAPVGA